jgi:type IV pilus assembly protein PilO
MKKLLDEIKSVNPRDPGGWPLTVKLTAYAAIFLVVVVLGFILDWNGQLDELSGAQQQEAVLKDAFLAKKKQAINLDIMKKQLAETQESFGALLKQLPNKAEMDALLTDINQAGLGRGLQFELFRPGPETINGVFAEQPITIRVTGNYDDIGSFSSDVAQLPRIVTLNNISINSANSGPNSAFTGPLAMEAIAKTFRYLDEDELAAQKKAAAAAAKGAKK